MSDRGHGTTLAEAFQDWIDGHGVVWFDDDRRLAEAIAEELGIDLKWSEDYPKELLT